MVRPWLFTLLFALTLNSAQAEWCVFEAPPESIFHGAAIMPVTYVSGFTLVPIGQPRNETDTAPFWESFQEIGGTIGEDRDGHYQFDYDITYEEREGSILLRLPGDTKPYEWTRFCR